MLNIKKLILTPLYSIPLLFLLFFFGCSDKNPIDNSVKTNQIIISEIHFVSGDSDYNWFEIYNPTNDSLTLIKISTIEITDGSYDVIRFGSPYASVEYRIGYGIEVVDFTNDNNKSYKRIQPYDAVKFKLTTPTPGY